MRPIFGCPECVTGCPLWRKSNIQNVEECVQCWYDIDGGIPDGYMVVVIKTDEEL